MTQGPYLESGMRMGDNDFAFFAQVLEDKEENFRQSA